MAIDAIHPQTLHHSLTRTLRHAECRATKLTPRPTSAQDARRIRPGANDKPVTVSDRVRCSHSAGSFHCTSPELCDRSKLPGRDVVLVEGFDVTGSCRKTSVGDELSIWGGRRGPH
jgi:hypothetical protein